MPMIQTMLSGSTKKIGTVCDVDLTRYQGTWYEIARLPHPFEKDMEQVTAHYTLKKNGSVEVVNTGVRNGKTQTIKGKAAVVDPGCSGKLSVQFFPFLKSTYRIIALDKVNYDYALVTSSRKSYLWLLARTPVLDDGITAELVSTAKKMGFNVKKLIWVKHS